MRRSDSTLASATAFTLIEVVFALMIFGLMLTFAYGGLSAVMRSKDLLDDSRDARALTNSLLLRVTRELQLVSAAQPIIPKPGEAEAEGRRAVKLLGEKGMLKNSLRGDSITFTANEAGQYVMDGSSNSGVVQITYRVEADPEQGGSPDATYYLVRDEMPYVRPNERAYEKVMTFPITNALESLEIYYFDPQKGEWTDEWGSTNRLGLPSMIQFSIQLRTPDGKRERVTTAIPVRSRE